MAIFGPKPWVNTFVKMSFFRVFELLLFIAQKVVFTLQNIVKDIFLAFNFLTFQTSCFYSLETRFFALEYRKTHFPCLYCLKKKLGKMAIFIPKPWVNPFGKMSIFRVFELLFFIAQKIVFSLQNIVKDIFLAYITQKKKFEKMAIF